ncbi:DUF6493 family protein [Herbidospora cretacea]|uniref:DUF6493 family protein n=1 Tax=Herbidospora cretacea TaxID=28444 RepID=UPI000773BAAC|nr:DUF6493 family protein [Herbidospora cretacea]
MSLWTEITQLITDKSVTRLADRLVTLTEEERAELGGHLPGFVKELRARRGLDSWDLGLLLDDLAGTLLLAGIGVITGPAAAVTWMTSRDVNRRWAELDIETVCRVAATRPPQWRRDVAVRLAQRIRRPADRLAPLAVALLRESGATPPDHDPLVAAWLAAPAVEDDPLLPVLLPRVFDADGAGRALRDEQGGKLPTRWLAAALRELPRERVLDGCVSRFLRGGDAQDLRFFVRLHTLADPTPAESAPRLRDYLRLLPSAPGPVAELAAGQLGGAGQLDHADVVEAVEALTFRAEAKLAARGLRWLDQTIRATPDVAADFVGALTTAYAHTSFDVRNRAAELTLKHAGLLQDHAGAILDGVHHLPAGLGAKVAERFGGEAPAGDVPESKEFPPLPEVAAPKRFPEPSIFPDYHERWIGQERWLAAFVAGIAADRKKLRRKLKPHVDQDSGSWRSGDLRLDPDDWQSALAAELVTPGSAPALPPVASPVDSHEEWRRRNRLPRPNRVSPPHDFLLHRYAELAEALRDGAMPPVLLATPTWMSGHLDPDVLVDRLEICAAAGVEPLPADLAQALLRLPRGGHPAAADRAAAIDSEAARSAARWLAGGGMADPECGVVWRHMVGASMVEFGDDEPEHFTEVGVQPRLRVTAPTGHRLIDEVLLREPFDWWVGGSGGLLRSWPAVLPSHREVLAVNFLPFVLSGRWGSWSTTADLTGLVINQGPMGEATGVILAHLLSGGVRGTIPLILTMAAQGELPAEAIGRQLALVLRRTWRETRPALAALSELADAGGHHEVWRILTGLLPGMLPGEGRRITATHADLVAFAADVARWTGARGEIPVVAEFAKSRRTIRFVHECKRLHAQLTDPTP